MVASVVSHPPQQVSRRRSLGSAEVPVEHQQQQRKHGKLPRFGGGLLRRYSGGGPLRHTEEGGDQQQQQQPMESQSERGQSERGLGGLLRRAKSLRGSLERSNGDRRQRLGLQQQQQEKEDDEGPSGVASFLQQVGPSAPEAAPSEVDPAEEEEQGKKQGGMFRGLMKRATSFRSERKQQAKKEQQPQPPDLEPVLVLTDGNHGKVVFQGLDMVDPQYPSGVDMHASMPDLVSANSCKSPVESPNCKMDSSFNTARTSATARDSTLDDQYFLDFSDRGLEGEQEQPVPPEEQAQEPVKSIASGDEMPSSPLRDQMAGLFQRTKSGRIIIGGSSPVEGSTDTTTTDDSSGDCSTEEAEEVLNNFKPHGLRTVTASAPTCLQEITLPCLVEDDDEEDSQVDPYQGLLDVVEEDEEDEDDFFERRTCGSTSSMDSEDLDVFETNPPPGTYMRDHPKREYDELELFYEEQTFEHVGGSLLLGAQSELMTVPEYDEDYDSDEDEEREEEFEQEEEPCFMSGSNRSLMMSSSLLPIVEEAMEESYSSHDSGFSA